MNHNTTIHPLVATLARAWAGGVRCPHSTQTSHPSPHALASVATTGRSVLHGRTGWLAFATLLLSLVASVPAFAQRAELRIDNPPHYAGDPVHFQVSVTGFDESPEPTFELATEPKDVAVRLLGVRPRSFRSTTIVNGRMRVVSSVTHVLIFEVISKQPGEFEIPPMTIKQGDAKVISNKFSIQFKEVQISDRIRLVTNLPDKPVYPGQRVPVELEWWYSGNTKDVRNLAIRWDLFDRFTFIDDPNPDRSGPVAEIPITTKSGERGFVAQFSERQFNGQTYNVFTLKRELLAETPGTYEIEPATVTMDHVTRWGRDQFLELMAVESQRIRNISQPVTLKIQDVPAENRPDSYAGAIGTGFSIDVTADRTVVRAGDPIELAITIKGDANLEKIALPTFTGEGGLPADMFRLPQGSATGEYDSESDSKRFNVAVRVLDANVGEVPKLAYSWFNPNTETYETAYSEPIALRVQEATKVSASQVVSAVKKDPDTESTDTADPDTSGTTPGTGVATPSGTSQRSRFSFSGADLAIETRPQVLLANHSTQGSLATQATLYGLSTLILVIAFVARQRSNVDPAVIERRNKLRELRSVIDQAANRSRSEAADDIASSLRGVLAMDVTPDQRTEIDRLVAASEALSYAPSQGDDSNRIDPTIHSDALSLLDRIMKGNS